MNQTNTAISKPARSGRPWIWIAGILGAVFVIIIAIFAMMMRMNAAPPDLNLSSTLDSDAGLFKVSYIPEVDMRANQIHTWKLHVETQDGKPVENAIITVDGDMPQHGHGLPTRTRVTNFLGNFDFQVEGLKFHMTGWWIVEFNIQDGEQSDHITFNLVLEN
jgi:hypothetical protein